MENTPVGHPVIMRTVIHLGRIKNGKGPKAQKVYRGAKNPVINKMKSKSPILRVIIKEFIDKNRLNGNSYLQVQHLLADSKIFQIHLQVV